MGCLDLLSAICRQGMPMVFSSVIVDLQEVIANTKENPRIIHATELMNLVSAIPSSLGSSCLLGQYLCDW